MVRESIHLFLPARPLSATALREIDVDPDKVSLRYDGGFRDPLIEQIARNIQTEMPDPAPAGDLHDERDREPEQHGASCGANAGPLSERPGGDEADLPDAAEDRTEVAAAVGVLAAGARRARDPVRRPVPGGGFVSPPRAAPHKAAAGLPRGPRLTAVGAALSRGKRRPGEIAAPVATGSRGTASSGAIPPGLGNAGAVSRLAAGPHGERDAFPTLPTGSPWSLESSGKDCPVESLGVRRSPRTPKTTGVPSRPDLARSGAPATTPSGRSCNAGKQNKRSFHSHRPTHGISDSPDDFTDALTATYDLKRVWFDPDPHDRSSWVHFVRATYYVRQGHVLQGLLPDPVRHHGQPFEPDVRARARNDPAPLRLGFVPHSARSSSPTRKDPRISTTNS